MGFISAGDNYELDVYKSRYLTQKRLQDRRLKHTKKKSRSKEPKTSELKKSILERLPVELLYEIYIDSGISDLHLASKYFHHVLKLSTNKHLVRKWIRHNIFHHGNKVVMNLQLLHSKYICLEDLEPYHVDRFAQIDPLELEIDDRNYDFPERFYTPTVDNLPMILYLLDRNMEFMDPDQLAMNLLNSDMKFSKRDIKKMLGKSRNLKDHHILVEILQSKDAKLRRWLLAHYDTEELRNDENLWRQHLSIENVTILKRLLWPNGLEEI